MPEQKPARRAGVAPISAPTSATTGLTEVEVGIARAFGCAPSDFYREDRARLDTDARLTPPVLARGGLTGWRCRRVIEFIEAHLADELRLAALAAVVDLSPYYFARAFKQSFGVPPHRYHMTRRIERAKLLLAEPTASVTTISVQLGFADTSSFSTTFRRLTGQPPSRYRRAIG
jgi:AraC family transcriptional regulator